MHPPRHTYVRSTCPIGDYVLQRRLSQSRNSEVYLGEHKLTGRQVAVKITPLRRDTQHLQQQGSKEWKIHQALNHPHIVPFIGVVEEEDRIYTITHYAAGEDLAAHIRKWQEGSGGSRQSGLPIGESWRIFSQLLQAVRYLHSCGYAHMDIKPENIFLDLKGNVLLGDFGLAFTLNEDQDNTSYLCGTLGYSTPPCSIWASQRPNFSGREGDCWALGVTLYTMLHGRGPFDASCPLKVMKKCREGRYRWRREEPEAQGAKEIVAMLLEVDPKKRGTLLDIFNHTWLHLTPPTHMSHQRTSSAPTISADRRETRRGTRRLVRIGKFSPSLFTIPEDEAVQYANL